MGASPFPLSRWPGLLDQGPRRGTPGRDRARHSQAAVHRRAAVTRPSRHSRCAPPAAVSNRSNVAPLLDHLVGPQQERLRNRQAERLRGGQIDDEIELVGCSTGKFAAFAPRKILSTSSAAAPREMRLAPAANAAILRQPHLKFTGKNCYMLKRTLIAKFTVRLCITQGRQHAGRSGSISPHLS